jgi:SAM-dependent methyltransferase
MVRSLKKSVGHAAAMEIGVGGDFERFGRLEADLLVHLGLREGNCVIDVGCGSGRLAVALGKHNNVTYHGCDIVPDFLEHARRHTPPHFRFSLVDGLNIPDADGVADFVTFFSVATHLMHHETYLYLEEARRTAKPGGRIVVSFLEFDVEQHWAPFADIVEATRKKRPMHLNAFIEASVFPVWARHLGLELEAVLHHGVFPNPREGGTSALGQSVAVLRKPSGPGAAADAPVVP